MGPSPARWSAGAAPELPMSPIDFVLYYVSDVARAAAFWSHVFGGPPVEQSPGFAMFVLPNGLKFGLWLRAEVLPIAAAPGGAEVAIALGSAEAVDAAHDRYRSLGLQVLQPPTAMDFGYTFTAADPDGNRIRLFVPQG